MVEPIPQADWVTDTALYVVGGVTQVPVLGTLIITSAPAGAEAFVDGEFVGFTPVTFGAPEGRHRVRVELSGYRKHRTRVELSSGQTVMVEANLRPRHGGDDDDDD